MRTALLAPLLLIAYAVCRHLDGLVGDHGPGLAWNVGHTFFLAAFVCFGLLILRLAREVARPYAGLLAAAGLAGVAAFCWVILGDLFTAMPEAPEVVEIAGPLLFQVGLLGLLAALALRSEVPWWSVAATLAGFVVIGANLDLLTLGAVLLLTGLSPFARQPSPSSSKP